MKKIVLTMLLFAATQHSFADTPGVQDASSGAPSILNPSPDEKLNCDWEIRTNIQDGTPRDKLLSLLRQVAQLQPADTVFESQDPSPVEVILYVFFPENLKLNPSADGNANRRNILESLQQIPATHVTCVPKGMTNPRGSVSN